MTVARLHPRTWSFAARLTLGITAVVAATLVVVTLITTKTVRTALTRQIGENFLTGAEGLNHSVGAFFLEKVGQIQALAVTGALRKALVERNASYVGEPADILAEIQGLDEYWISASDEDPVIHRLTCTDPEVNPVAAQLGAFLKVFPAHTELFATDRYGATVGATGRLSDYYQADEGWWQAAWAGGKGSVYVSAPQFDESAQVTALLIAVPVVDGESGEFIGVVRSTLVVDELSRLLAGVSYGETGGAVLLDGSGDILFGPGAERGGASALARAERERFLAGDAGTLIAVDRFGDRWLFAHAHFRDTAGGADETSLEREILAEVADLGWVIVVQQRVDEAFASVEPVTRNVLAVGLVALALAPLVALFMARSVTRPLIQLGEAADEIGRGNLNAELPPVRNNEIGRLARSFANMTTRLRELIGTLSSRTEELSLANWVLEQRSMEIGLLGEMSHLLQACSSAAEAHKVIATFVPRILPADSGSVSVMYGERERVTTVAAWGSLADETEVHVFKPKDCWALRRGQLHAVETPGSGMLCDHLNLARDAAGYELMCVPMMAQGETLGLLHLQRLQRRASKGERATNEDATLGVSGRRLATAVADQIGLALSNLQLQETLRHQAIRDPLTGVFNRRYMEESLERELVRAHRKGSPLGLLMLDIDHFKRFNDSFGHDAGDCILENLAESIRGATRGEDVVCRYGGEEFAVILPDTSLGSATERAEDLLERARRLDLQFRGECLGRITLSAGVVVYPDHGLTARDLFRAADVALYRAKEKGRDRVFALEPARLRLGSSGSG